LCTDIILERTSACDQDQPSASEQPRPNNRSPSSQFPQ
jgi:hypothetical protein